MSTGGWIYGYYSRDKLVRICNEEIHKIFRDFPIIEGILRQGVYGAPFIDELQDLDRELFLLQSIFDKIDKNNIK